MVRIDVWIVNFKNEILREFFWQNDKFKNLYDKFETWKNDFLKGVKARDGIDT